MNSQALQTLAGIKETLLVQTFETLPSRSIEDVVAELLYELFGGLIS